MGEGPSDYEKRAWLALHTSRQRRPVARTAQRAGESAHAAVTRVGRGVERLGEAVPQLRQAQHVVVGASRRVGEAIPDSVKKGAGEAASAAAKVTEGATRALSRAATSTLNGDRVVKAHARRGHPVERLSDLRELDLEAIDDVRPRGLDMAYSAAAAVVGVGSGIVMTGSTIAVPVSAGAAAAPSAGAIAGAMVADAAAVLGLCARVVGHVAVYYGYDPGRVEEKVFQLTVVNLGTASTASAKAAAYADVSRLTQMLFRGSPWRVLNETMTARLTDLFAKRFAVRLTQRGLGKVVPIVGVGVGASLNWLTLEQVADAADLAYRRRFLLDKYPDLSGNTDVPTFAPDGGLDDEIQLTDLMDEVGLDALNPETDEGGNEDE